MILRFKENMVMSRLADNRQEERIMMPSFGHSNRTINNKIKYKATQKTLRANKKACLNSTSLSKSRELVFPLSFQKRVSLSGFSYTYKASMTVEAAVIVSLFLIVILNLLSILDFVRLQSSMAAALHQVGKRLSIYGYAYDKSGLEIEEYPLTSVVFSYTYVKSSVEKYMGEGYLENTVLKNGKSGVYYGNSRIMENDRIDIIALYEVSGLFHLNGIKGIPMFSRFYGHVWNGYDVENQGKADDAELYVFITKNGTVYHRNRSCTYLNPSVKAVHFDDLNEKRNENGAVYYACERCGTVKSAVAYVTEQGTRYHTSLECSGLKRTVYSIPFTEVGNRAPCSKCGF